MQMRVKRHFVQTASQTIAPIDRVVVQQDNKQNEEAKTKGFNLNTVIKNKTD